MEVAILSGASASDAAKVLSGSSFSDMGMQARIASLMLRQLEKGGASKLAETLEGLGDQLPEMRERMDTAAAGLRWAAELCETASSLLACGIDDE
jgi:hypothetical protein